MSITISSRGFRSFKLFSYNVHLGISLRQIEDKFSDIFSKIKDFFCCSPLQRLSIRTSITGESQKIKNRGPIALKRSGAIRSS
jgi:hypothetical protein